MAQLVEAATSHEKRFRDPVCGMDVSSDATGRSYLYDGHEYHFCNPRCLEKFTTEPTKYIEAQDPVCGMTVNRATAQHLSRHNGVGFYFCSQSCQQKFDVSPETYLSERDVPEPMPAGTLYTCPMHPEIVQEGPGDCPLCGMALEPMGVPAPDEGPNPELVDFTWRFWIGLMLSIPVLLIAMGPHLAIPVNEWIPRQFSIWTEFVLATPVVLWSGWPFFKRGWASIVNKSLNMFTLIAIGTGAAYLYSAAATLAPSIFPDTFRQPDGSVGVYFEAAAVIIVLVLLGQVLELRARERTGGAIRALLDLAPKTASKVVYVILYNSAPL